MLETSRLVRATCVRARTLSKDISRDQRSRDFVFAIRRSGTAEGGVRSRHAVILAPLGHPAFVCLFSSEGFFVLRDKGIVAFFQRPFYNDVFPSKSCVQTAQGCFCGLRKAIVDFHP